MCFVWHSIRFAVLFYPPFRVEVLKYPTIGLGSCSPDWSHCYITGLCSRPFIPAAFRSGTIGGFLSRVQQLAGPVGGTGVFCPGWRYQSGQKGGLLSRLVSPTGTKLLGPLIPFPLPPPEPFSSLVLAVLGSGERSSCSFLHHIVWRSLIPRPSIGVKGLGLVFLFFLGLYSSFHALEIEKIYS